jgi:polysaccharide biosynthesis protein PslG
LLEIYALVHYNRRMPKATLGSLKNGRLTGKRIKPHHIHLSLVAIIAVGVAFAVATGTFVTKVAFVHGPHPNTLKERHKQPGGRGMLSTAIVAELAAETPPPAIKPQPQPQALALPVSALGIAAGGGPVYWGQSDLDTYFASLQDLGVKWVRWDVIWEVVQPENAEHYDWSAVDRVVHTAQRHGITSLAILSHAPQWARLEACQSDSNCRPDNPTVLGHFARAAAERYRDSIQYWEIWNEPNHAYIWKPSPNAEVYAAMLEAAYTNIKAVNPGATVLSAGLAATGDEADGSIAPITFMSGLYRINANRFLDHVSLHPYTYPALPSHQAWWNRWQQIDPIRQLMESRGDGAKKVWLTEFGAPTNGPGDAFAVQQLDNFDYGTDFMTEQAQKQLMEEALAFYRQRSDWMGPFFWYNLRDEGGGNDTTEDFFGLLRRDGSKKPAYETYKKAISP